MASESATPDQALCPRCRNPIEPDSGQCSVCGEIIARGRGASRRKHTLMQDIHAARVYTEALETGADVTAPARVKVPTLSIARWTGLAIVAFTIIGGLLYGIAYLLSAESFLTYSAIALFSAAMSFLIGILTWLLLTLLSWLEVKLTAQSAKRAEKRRQLQQVRAAQAAAAPVALDNRDAPLRSTPPAPRRPMPPPHELRDSPTVLVLSILGTVLGSIGTLISFTIIFGILALYLSVPATLLSGTALYVAVSRHAKRTFAVVALTISLIGVVVASSQIIMFYALGTAVQTATDHMREERQKHPNPFLAPFTLPAPTRP